MIRVYIDSCAWDIFYEGKWAPSSVLPSNRFEICVIPEVLTEIKAIGADQAEKRAFILDAVTSSCVKVDKILGFSAPDASEEEKARWGGPDDGRFFEASELKFVADNLRNDKANKRNGFMKNEVDAYLAARATLVDRATHTHSVVLTRDDKSGPLSSARKDGFCVISLDDLKGRDCSLADYIFSKLPTS